MQRGPIANHIGLIAAGLTSLALGVVDKSHAAALASTTPVSTLETNLNTDDRATDKIYPASHPSKAIQTAIEIVQRKQLHCSVTNAAYRHGPIEQIEFSCRQGLGYISSASESNFGPADCVMSQTNPTRCTLPENGHPALGLAQYLDEAGVDCKPDKARFIAGINNSRLSRFEVKCAASDGYVLDVPFYRIDGYAEQLLREPFLNSAAYNCLQAPALCKLTSHRESVLGLSKKVTAGLSITCDPEDARYIGHPPAKNADIYELKCRADRDSLLVTINFNGSAISAVPCNTVRLSGGECNTNGIRV